MFKIKFKRQKIFKRFLSIALAISTLCSILPLNAFADDLEYDMSYSNGSGGGVTSSAGGYQIDNTDNNCVGYRLSIVSTSGAKVSGTQVWDIFARNYGTNGTYAGSSTISRYKLFRVNSDGNIYKNNKTQWNDGYTDYYGKFSTSKKHSCWDDDINITFNTDPTKFKSWATDKSYGDVRKNRICKKLGFDYSDWEEKDFGSAANGLNENGYTLIVEPIFALDIAIKGKGNQKAVMTISDIGMYGGDVFGGNAGTSSSGAEGTWGWISKYTNRNWPHSLKTSEKTNFTTESYNWSVPSGTIGYVKFKDLVKKGYGVGIAAGTPPDGKTEVIDDKNVYISAWNTFLGSFSQNSDGVWLFNAAKPIKSVRCKKDVSYENGEI